MFTERLSCGFNVRRVVFLQENRMIGGEEPEREVRENNACLHFHFRFYLSNISICEYSNQIEISIIFSQKLIILRLGCSNCHRQG